MDEVSKQSELSKRTKDILRSREHLAHCQRYGAATTTGKFQCNYIDLASDGVAALLNAFAVSKGEIDELKDDDRLKSAVNKAEGDYVVKSRRRRRMSTINFQKDDSVVIKRKAKQLMDYKNRYCHVIVTSKMDDCSQSTM